MKAAAILGSALLVLAATAPVPAQDDFDLQETLDLCTSCHGEEGLPTGPEIPIIWGQEFYYLYVQLKDYKAGRRANEIMEGIVTDFDKAQMKKIAQHFAEKEWPGHQSDVDAAIAEKGPMSLDAGQCSQCHSTYSGDSRVPRLAGQTPEYLEKTMQDFKQRIRLNSPAKGSLISSFDDDQIAAMAQYLAGL